MKIVLLIITIVLAGCTTELVDSRLKSTSEFLPCTGDVDNSDLFSADSLVLDIPLHKSIYNERSCNGIQFQSIDSDSRCPLDVVCIWAGEVSISLLVSTGETAKIITLKNIVPHEQIRVDGSLYKITLVNVSPVPGSGQDIKPYASIEIVRVK